MTFSNLGSLISHLQREEKVYIINEQVSPILEMTEIADRIYQNREHSAPVLFTNNGTSFPVLMNIFVNEELSQNYVKWHEVSYFLENINSLFQFKLNHFIISFFRRMLKTKPKRHGHAPCQEVVNRELNFSHLPILQCWPGDGGRYITLPLVHTIDPETGIQNMGMYRMQIFDEKTAGLHWHLHKGGAEHYRKWKQLGKRMPVTVTLGGAPALIYAATAPLPQGISEYALAGFLLNKRIPLVKSLTNDIWIPADSEIVLEGYVNPDEELRLEGPFGDHTGFYSIPDYYPVFHLEIITHRKKAIYPATIVGVPPKEDEQLGQLTTKLFAPIIKSTVLPELVNIHFPTEGGFHNLSLVGIRNEFPGQAEKVAHAIWGTGLLSLTKILFIFEEKTPLHDWNQILNEIDRNVSIPDDILLSRGPLDVLDHAAKHFAYGGKLAINATKKFKKPHEYDTTQPQLPFFHRWIAPRIDVIYHDDFSEVHTWLEKNQPAYDKFYIVMEKRWQNVDFSYQLWFALTTIDPVRDVHFQRNTRCLVVNCLSYEKSPSPANASWPEMVLMDEMTIQHIDQRWTSLGFDFFQESPSRLLRKQIK